MNMRLTIGIAVGFILGLLVGVSSRSFQSLDIVTPPPTATPDLYTLKGSLVVHDSSNWHARGFSTDEHCTGYWARNDNLKDLREGTQVTLKDQASTILGVGSFGKGKFSPYPPSTDYRKDMGVCVFEFEIDKVPRRTFYILDIRGHGSINYSLTDLDQKSWTIELSLK